MPPIVQAVVRIARASSARVQRLPARELAAWSAAVLMLLAMTKLWLRVRKA